MFYLKYLFTLIAVSVVVVQARQVRQSDPDEPEKMEPPQRVEKTKKAENKMEKMNKMGKFGKPEAGGKVGGEAKVGAEGDAKVGAEGDAKVGAEGDAKVGAEGDAKVGAEGDAKVGAEGDAKVGAEGDAKVGAEGDAKVGAEGDAKIGAEGDAKVGAEGDAKIGAEGDAKIGAEGDAKVGAEGDAKVGAGGGHGVRPVNLGGRSTGTGFCYNDAEGCGPGTAKWPEICRTGTSQSPIDFNMNPSPGSKYFIKLTGYKVPHFKMTNNGHSVVIGFEGVTNDGGSPHLSKSENATDVEEDRLKNRYQFAQAHFHWGKGDAGSEHSVDGHYAAMELHLVHYSKLYKNISEALNSDDPKAMVVIGVLFEDREAEKSHVALRPVIDNLSKIQIPDHMGTFERISEHLDFSTLFEEPSQFYNYHGSLTTPGCQEIVNWFVLKKWLKITAKDLDAFRTHIKDDQGRKLLANHRPAQPLHDRDVSLSEITFVYPGTA